MSSEASVTALTAMVGGKIRQIGIVPKQHQQAFRFPWEVQYSTCEYLRCWTDISSILRLSHY